MSKTMHLTDEAILELAGNRLSGPDLLAVEAHIAQCAQCSKRCNDLRFAHSVFARLADVGIDGVRSGGSSMQRPAAKRPRKTAFPWAWVGGIVVSSLLLLAIFVMPGNIRQASASELLSDAMRSEVHLPPAAAFRIQIGGEACARGVHNDKLVSLANSDRCKKALRRLQSSSWGHSNPLTAGSYAQWRSSLRRRHDRVTKRGASWEVTTTTDEGEVREARLEMRLDDYHPTRLTLDFDGEEEVNISETTEPAPAIALAKPVTPPPPKAHPVEVDDPIDLLEVDAWSTLYRLGADTGWEGVVIRNGSQVEVELVADNDEQKRQFLTAFAPRPEIGIKVHSSTDAIDQENILPDRMRPNGNEAGLAEGWLEERFPGTETRTKYSNETLRYSRQILGRTFFLDQLQQRQQALRRCSCNKDLSKLVSGEMHVVLSLQEDLSANLEPLIGAHRRANPRTLTFSQAQELDFALGTLFYRSLGPDQAALDTSLQQIANLLSTHPES
jgi:hypothetical protein